MKEIKLVRNNSTNTIYLVLGGEVVRMLDIFTNRKKVCSFFVVFKNN